MKKLSLITVSIFLLHYCNTTPNVYKDDSILVHFPKNYQKNINKCPLENCLAAFNHNTLPIEVMILDIGKINGTPDQWIEKGISTMKNDKLILSSGIIDDKKNCQKALILFKSYYIVDKSDKPGINLSSLSLIKTENSSRQIYWRFILPNSSEKDLYLQKGLFELVETTLMNIECN